MIETVKKNKSPFKYSYPACKQPVCGFTIIELMAVIIVFGLSVAAVALRFSKSNDTERLAKCQQKIADILKTSCSQSRVYHSPVKLTYDLKNAKVTTEQISQFASDKNSIIEFSLDKGIYIDQICRSKSDCISEAVASFLIQPGGWLDNHVIVLRNSKECRILFWNPKINHLSRFEDIDKISWGQN